MGQGEQCVNLLATAVCFRWQLQMCNKISTEVGNRLDLFGHLVPEYKRLISFFHNCSNCGFKEQYQMIIWTQEKDVSNW